MLSLYRCARCSDEWVNVWSATRDDDRPSREKTRRMTKTTTPKLAASRCI